MAKRWKVTSKADTSDLFRKLRLVAQENGMILYNVLVRHAGIGFSYADRTKASSFSGDKNTTVFCYHRGSLRNAVVREIERWRGRP